MEESKCPDSGFIIREEIIDLKVKSTMNHQMDMETEEAIKNNQEMDYYY